MSNQRATTAGNPVLGPCSPFFIVSDMLKSLEFYIGTLGFDVRHMTPEENPFFAIVGRDQAQILLKTVGIEPQPNPKRHPWVKWDAFVLTAAPDVLFNELSARGATFQLELSDTGDGLRGFEIQDPDGYVLFFGKPISASD